MFRSSNRAGFLTAAPERAAQDDSVPGATTSVDELLAYRAVLRAFVARRVRSPEDAEDCLQDVYARVVATLPGKKIENARAFLFRIASSVLVDRVRTIKAGRRVRTDVPLEEASEVRDATDPEQLVFARQQLLRMQQALDQLDPVRRRCFVLARVQGWSHEEVARELGIDRYAVARHLERALFHVTRVLASES